MSSGSCQFPTLGFVVDRYFRVKKFVPEKFWSIKVMHLRDGIKVQFSWRRNRLFDRGCVVVLFERCLAARLAKVSKTQRKPTSKWRPLPLTTVELQKLGSKYLRMDSQKVMKVKSIFLHFQSRALILARSQKSFTTKAGSATPVRRLINSTRALICKGSFKNKLKTAPGDNMLRGMLVSIHNFDSAFRFNKISL